MKYTFYFDQYQVQGQEIAFPYHYVDESGDTIGAFTERFVFPASCSIDPSDKAAQRILQHLHCIVGISYYKSLLGDIVTPYNLTAAEAAYYNDIYDNGLGEFSYVNKYTQPIRPFVSAVDAREPTPVELETNGAILGIGGGKDSIVAGEILKGIDIPTSTLSIGTRDHHGQADKVMHVMGLPEIHVERYVDTAISEFRKSHQGMSGHIPLSVILAWVGVLIAYSQRIRYVAMGNEGATSTGNVVWNGREINHQWAKSLQQEQLTQHFIAQNISPDITYLSPIRPYSSLMVMGLLAKLGQPYLDDFTSCNLVLRIDPTERPNGRWCTHCAKCVSTWLLLSSWLDDNSLVEIFGRNLWNDETLQPTVRALLGLEGHKPLDCVGTTEELRAVARKRLEAQNVDVLLADIPIDTIPGPTIEELVESCADHNLSSELCQSINDFVENTL